jgi:hypothetical protein
MEEDALREHLLLCRILDRYPQSYGVLMAALPAKRCKDRKVSFRAAKPRIHVAISSVLGQSSCPDFVQHLQSRMSCVWQPIAKEEEHSFCGRNTTSTYDLFFSLSVLVMGKSTQWARAPKSVQ